MHKNFIIENTTDLFRARFQRVRTLIILTCFLAALSQSAHAQVLDRKVTLSIKEMSLAQALKEIEKASGIPVYYNTEQVAGETNVSLTVVDQPLRTVLQDLLTPRGMVYQVYEKERTITVKKEAAVDTPALQNKERDNGKTKKRNAISGKVVESVTNNPMPGVNILLRGTTIGTTTDADGNYTLEAGDNDWLTISFIGYKTMETKIEGRSVINITLEEDISSLNEVVVNAGYYEVKEKEQTGNIIKVTSVDIAKQPVSNPLQALQGRVAGLYIQQANGVPGSNITVRIRGQNSLTSGNDPLYIIDNVPFMPGNLSSTATSAGILGSAGVSPLNSINPADIESIEVLKDADATAIYGSRGANGVILITTKRGKASLSGKPKIDFNYYSGFSRITNKMNLLSTPQHLALRRQAFALDESAPAAYNAPDLLVWDTTRYTDWQRMFIGNTAHTSNMQATVSGGSETTQFSFNGGYEKQGTVFPGELSADKISSRLSVSHASKDQRFKSMFALLYSSNSSNLIAQDFTRKALTLAPDAPAVYNPDGTLNWENSTWDNPLSELQVKYKSRTNNLIANANLSYEIVKGWEVSTSVGFNDMHLTDKNSLPSAYYNPAYQAGPEYAELNLNNGSAQSWIIEPKMTYTRDISKGKITLLAGGTFQDKRDEQLTQYGTGFPSDALIEDIGSAATVRINEYRNTVYRYGAAFGRVNYNHDGKYILNVTARRDGSSRFGPQNRFTNFGAVGAAWIFSREQFMESLSFLSFGKLRASFGTTGNDQIGDYRYLSTYQSSGIVYQNSAALSPTRLFNPDFAWEVNRKWEGGLNLGFFKDRVELSASFYRNRSSNQLIDYPLAMTTGFTGVQANLDATIQNQGWEWVLNTTNIRTDKVTWTSSVNISVPRNKLIAFPLLESSTYANKYQIGEPVTIVKRYHYLGIDPVSGAYSFEDLNRDGVITSADQLQVSNVGVKYFGGLNNTVIYKGWQLDFLFQFVRQTGISYVASSYTLPGTGLNQPVDIVNNTWSKEGEEYKKYQRATTGLNGDAVNAFNRYAASDAAVVDASFIRMKNIALSYSFPERWTANIKSRLFIQGQNLFTITNYFGLDPENYSAATLPPLKTIAVGVQLGF